MKHPEMCILNYKIFMKLMNFVGNTLNLKNKSDMLQSRKKNSLLPLQRLFENRDDGGKL